MPSVLIVDDLLSIHEMLEAVIQPTGFSTAFATDGEKALARYKAERYDIVLADIDMKPMDGITLLKQLKAYDPSSVVIIMTAYASTESAIQALKFGAFDYMQKPFRVDDLIATLKRGLAFKQFTAERASAVLSPSVKAVELESRLIGQGPVNKRLVQQVRKLVSVRTPVLLQGEVGTGRTTVAEVLHAGSASAEAPLVRIDCALSSASDFRAGLLGNNGSGGIWIDKARGGTLLLQNLHGLDLPTQQELVGVLRNTAHGFRLICTTTEDLDKLTDEGRFNDELFYRVASLPIVLSPLRDRIEDIPLLVKHFLGMASNPSFEAALIEFTEDALQVLQAYHWPGNLSELGQTITKVAAVTTSRVVTAAQLPLRLKEVKDWPKLVDYLASQERHYVEMVLNACRGDRVAAARILGGESANLLS
jgi:two-component system, NtrC family, response regulator HydG